MLQVQSLITLLGLTLDLRTVIALPTSLSELTSATNRFNAFWNLLT